MGRRLKQIKKQDLGENTKRVVDSLIANTSAEPRKEQKYESMRCKVEIYDGSQIRVLTDSFIVNTNCLEDLVHDLNRKYGANVQFKITNLYDEKTVAKAFVYVGGYSKEKDERICFNRQMDIVKRMHKLKEEGKSIDEACIKLSYFAAKSYLKELFNKSEEEIIQNLRDRYKNQSLGKQDYILSENINTNNDILSDSNLDNENTSEGENNDE